MIHNQKVLTSSADKPLLCVLFVSADKISSTKLYRILTSDRSFPYPNRFCARILMEFRETVTVLYIEFKDLKYAANYKTGLYLPKHISLYY